MIIFGTMGLQTGHKVAHTVPCCQLAKEHAEHLVPTGKAPDVLVSLMGFDDTDEDPPWKKLGNLGEDIFSLVHGIF